LTGALAVHSTAKFNLIVSTCLLKPNTRPIFKVTILNSSEPSLMFDSETLENELLSLIQTSEREWHEFVFFLFLNKKFAKEK